MGNTCLVLSLLPSFLRRRGRSSGVMPIPPNVRIDRWVGGWVGGWLTHLVRSLLPSFLNLSGPSSGVMPIPPNVRVRAASVSPPSSSPNPFASAAGSLADPLLFLLLALLLSPPLSSPLPPPPPGTQLSRKFLTRSRFRTRGEEEAWIVCSMERGGGGGGGRLSVCLVGRRISG